jgi:hypothetical protein
MLGIGLSDSLAEVKLDSASEKLDSANDTTV